MTHFTKRLNNVLITGGEQNDRVEYAKKLAARILCMSPTTGSACESCINCKRLASNVHPNLQFIEPLGSGSDDPLPENNPHSDNNGTIKIDQIRRVILESQKANFEKGISVFIITHMHKTTKAAANAMLKVMEENELSKLFIALSPSMTAVLPTIASRLICHRVRPKAMSAQVDQRVYDLIIKISTTKPNARFSFCSDMNNDREEFMKEIDCLLSVCHVTLRNNLLSKHFGLFLAEALDKAQRNLRKNINPRMVLETLLFCDWPFLNRAP